MKTLTFDMAANESKRFEMPGRFLRVVNAIDASLSIQWLFMGKIIGEAEAVGSFFAVDTGVADESFEAFIITSNQLQTAVKISVSQWAVEAV